MSPAILPTLSDLPSPPSTYDRDDWAGAFRNVEVELENGMSIGVVIREASRASELETSLTEGCKKLGR